MNEKDIQIIRSSALAIADQIASITPGLNIAWGLSKALYGAGLKLREQKALEWVEMVKDNPSVFTEAILQNDKFQDGFVYALERYIKEKNEDKRKSMKTIFLGFTESTNQDQFELERMYHVLSILNLADLIVLWDVDIAKNNFHQVYEQTVDKNENIHNLVNVGILMSDYSSRLGPIAAPFVRVTEFGKEFIKFLR
ncbi:MAG: hypothetical protein UY22_C0043G0004 [Candidatus Amesbacteria bacterium GW2011_GWC1_48_10]|uniref:Uncharacterized protein n=2 Tax=Patescibacteria group TaxID=1783273 RepID=A0A0G1WM13_9BACT|nr:MAG: hypothetical protein UY22_C0043G0004 [Candidatus Amesbacteria bacterium GW2011_GWC1_48_10]KKW22751.1 MAG: hypothetical protein UY67_C0036G0001 [Candidatus Kaiserbacteria bacterium GW2011_GWA2_52_12]